MRTLGLGLLLGLMISTQGCALCFRGDEQDVTLQSATIADLSLVVDGVPLQVSPVGSGCSATVTLDRNRVHLVRVDAAGYDPLEITMIPCIDEDWLFAEQCTLWPILWLPMALDLNTGALNDLVSPVDLSLKRTPPPPPAKAGDPNPPAAPQPKVTEIKLMTRKPGQIKPSVSDYRTARLEGVGVVVPETTYKVPQTDPLKAKLYLRDYPTSRMGLDDGGN